MNQYLHFIKSSWALLGFGFCSIFWGNLGQSFFISWYGSQVQNSLELSAAHYGSLYSIGTLGSAITIVIIGGLIDRWPLRRFTILVGSGLLIACLLFASAANAITLLFGFYLLRLCGQGLLPHAAQTTMARHFNQHRGKALSLAASGVPVGEVVLPLLAVALISTIGWRGSWVMFAITVPLLYLPIALCLLRCAPQNTTLPPMLNPQDPSLNLGRRAMLSDYRFWLALPAILAAPFMVTGVFIQQGFILSEKGWTPLWLASCFIVYGMTHWLSSLVAGVLIDVFSARKLLPYMPTPLLAALLILGCTQGQWVAPLFMALLGVAIGIASPITGALWAEVYGTARLGSIRSLMTAFMVFSTAASPVLFGALIDRGASLAYLFGGCAVAVLGSIALVSFSYPRSKKPTSLV